MTGPETIQLGSGRTRVLLIHGSGSAAKPISRLGERIVAEVPDSQAVAVSLAGYGSEAPDPRLPRIEQHLHVLQTAMGPDRWHLVGHSMGGFLALQLARRVPGQIESLSLIEPTAFGVLDSSADGDALEADRAVIRRFANELDSERGISQFIEAWNQSDWLDLPEALRRNLISMASLIYEEASAVSADTTKLTDYASLTQPILLLAGTASLLPAKRIVMRLSELPPVSRLHWVERAGHMTVLRDPDVFAHLISAHITEHARSGS